MVHLFEWRLLLVKGVNGVLLLCKTCSLSVYVLPPGFDMRNCCLPSLYGFLLLTERLNLLLDSDQLLLFYGFVFEGFFLPVLYLDLFVLIISLNDLYWQRCLRGRLM
jgi:hypothetical protein